MENEDQLTRMKRKYEEERQCNGRDTDGKTNFAAFRGNVPNIDFHLNQHKAKTNLCPCI